MKFFPGSKIALSLYAVLGSLILFAFSCKKDKEAPVITPETGTMTDVEGNVYKTVKIGNQWWMAENLKVKKFSNGNLITHLSSSQNWIADLPGYCAWSDESNTTTNFPGLLYNWAVLVDSNNIAPEGWHIPTDAEWKALEKELGMSVAESDLSGWRGNDEGEKLKIESPADWIQYGDVWSTNASGFTARAGGCRLFDGSWADPGLSHTGFWWTASEYNSSDAWYRYLDYKNSNIFRSASSKHYGFSIRCVKN